LLAIVISHFVNWPVRLILCSLTVSPPSLGKPCCLTDSDLSSVDEDYYSDEDNQESLGMDQDESDDIRSLGSEDDG
jgi:hypothetical protein